MPEQAHQPAHRQERLGADLMASLLGVDYPFLDAAYRPQPQQEDTGYHSFMAARQQKLAERQQAFEEQKTSMLLPMQMEASRMQMQKASLDLIESKRKADAALNVKAGNALLAEKMATIDWSDPKDRASIWEIGKQYPDLIDSPEWNRIQQNFINSDKAANEAEKYKNQLQLMEQRYQLLKDKGEAGTATQQDIEAAQKLRRQAEALRQAGDTQGYQDRIRQAELLETHVAPKGVVSQMGYDDQGRPIMTTTIGGTQQPTVSTQSIAQQKHISFEMATEGINDIMSKLRPTDIGVAGVAGEHVFDRWLAQINPQFESGQRVSNRRALGALRETLFQALSPERVGGSGFSNKDAERIKEIASSLEAAHSYPEVRDSLNTIQGIIKDRARIYAERTGTPVPDFAKSPDEIQKDYVNRLNAIQKAVDNFTMTREQADAEAKALAQKTAESLRRFHGIEATFK